MCTNKLKVLVLCRIRAEFQVRISAVTGITIWVQRVSKRQICERIRLTAFIPSACVAHTPLVLPITLVITWLYFLDQGRNGMVPGVLVPPMVQEKTSSNCKTIQERQNCSASFDWRVQDPHNEKTWIHSCPSHSVKALYCGNGWHAIRKLIENVSFVEFANGGMLSFISSENGDVHQL